ncbi:MAG: hypothetical protein ACREB9_00940 [Thermoplasmata archaeon]
MLDQSDLEINLLEFRQKSFQYDRTVELDGAAYAVFTRTETETESQLRPKLVHLWVLVPRDWVAYDAGLDLLRIALEGTPLPAHLPGNAVESAAEPSEFREQGFDWVRAELDQGRYAYYPKERAPAFATEAGRAALRP